MARWNLRLATEEISTTVVDQAEVPQFETKLLNTDAVFRIGEEAAPISLDGLLEACKGDLQALVERGVPPDAALPRPGSPVTGTTAPVTMELRLRVPGLRLVAADARYFVRWLDLHVEVTTTFSTIAIGDGHSYQTAGTTDGKPHAARFALSHMASALPPRVELTIVPPEERFMLSSVGDDGTSTIIFSGAIVDPSTSEPSWRPGGGDK